jgi:hypothetical protein
MQTVFWHQLDAHHCLSEDVVGACHMGGLALHVSEIVRSHTPTPYSRKLKVTSPKSAASLPISMARRKMLCNLAIRARTIA